MKRQRFTNGTRKVLKRQYTSPEQISEIADSAVNNGSLWERGTGLKSLKSKDTKCTASGKYSVAYGVNAHALKNYEKVFASDIRFDGVNELKHAQKKEIILTVHPTGKDYFYFADSEGAELTIPLRTTWNCRIMVNLNMFDGGVKMVTWNGSIAVGNESGTALLRNQSITKAVDDTGGIFSFLAGVDGDRLKLRLSSNTTDNYIFAIAYVEILEMTWNH